MTYVTYSTIRLHTLITVYTNDSSLHYLQYYLIATTSTIRYCKYYCYYLLFQYYNTLFSILTHLLLQVLLVNCNNINYLLIY